jgi:hypothetical protein
MPQLLNDEQHNINCSMMSSVTLPEAARTAQ